MSETVSVSLLALGGALPSIELLGAIERTLLTVTTVLSYEPVTIRRAARTEAILFVGLAFVGGLATIYWGFQTYQFGTIIRDTPPERVQSLAMGRSEVKGRVKPAMRVFDQPFTDGQCVYAKLEVQEYKEYPHDDDKDDRWETVQTETLETPFYIQDETGRILIEPNDDTIYEISDEYHTRISVGKRESSPGPVQEFLGRGSSAARSSGRGKAATDGSPDEGSDDSRVNSPEDEERVARDGGQHSGESAIEHVSRGEIGSVGRTSFKRRYEQLVLPADEEAYVFGGATRKNPDEIGETGDSVVIQTDPSTGEFIISDKDEFALARTYRNRSILYMISGLICSAMILALLVQILLTGPVYGIDAAMP